MQRLLLCSLLMELQMASLVTKTCKIDTKIHEESINSRMHLASSVQQMFPIPPPRGKTPVRQRGGSSLRTSSSRALSSSDLLRGRSGCVRKPPTRARGHTIQLRVDSARLERAVADGDTSATEARDELPPTANLGTSNVPRTDTSSHACSELSLAFVASADLKTSPDTNVIALNLMDYFLFNKVNWLPELSYCKLHAACFLMASRITEMPNTAERLADSLGPETAFLQEMAALLAVNEDEDAAIRQLMCVDEEAVEDGYRLLYERREKLAVLLGVYADRLDRLPLPKRSEAEAERDADYVPEEDFDVFEEE